MDYEKMWKTLKRKLLDIQENFMRDSLGEDRRLFVILVILHLD